MLGQMQRLSLFGQCRPSQRVQGQLNVAARASWVIAHLQQCWFKAETCTLSMYVRDEHP